MIELDIRCFFSGNRRGQIQKDDAGLHVQKGSKPQLRLVHVIPVASPYHDLGQVAEWPCVYVILALIKAGLAVFNPDVDPGGVKKWTYRHNCTSSVL